MHSSRGNPAMFPRAPGSSPAPHLLAAGDTLAKRYRLDREAGRTEAGMVFDALDLTLNRRVAVEVASSIDDPKARRKWARDAMLAQRLEGEHVLRVLDVGNIAGDVPYAVREVALCTMAAEIEVKGALPIPLAAAWTLEACEAVAEAHAMGMAHGDLRLDNIYLVRGTNEPTVKVAWTSAAKAERAAKEDVARDLAGLGAMLRILSTGRSGDEEVDGAPTLPSDLAHAVSRALSIDPRERVQNVAELARLLAPYAPPGHPSARNVAFLMSRAGIVSGTIPGTSPISVRTPAVAPIPEASSAPIDFTDEWFGRGPRIPLVETLAPVPRHRARPAFAIVSVALIVLVLGGSWFLWQSGKLPRWTGAAPPEAVGKTEVTSAPATTAETTAAAPATAEPAPAEPVTTSVESLPSAPTAAAAPAAPVVTAPAVTPPVVTAPAVTSTPRTRHPRTDEPATTTPSAPNGPGGLRYVDPTPATTPPAPATTTTATPSTTATAAPTDDSTSTPAQAVPPSPPASAEPVPSQQEQPPPLPGY